MKKLLVVFSCVIVSACQTPVKLPDGELTFKAAGTVETDHSPYQIARGDVLAVNVYQEPDLSLAAVLVDSGGYISFPLVGQVVAAGKTGPELAADISHRLGGRYLVAPNVAVNVTTPSAPKVVVEGTVIEPGVFDIRPGKTTLLEALALAKGPTRTAKLSQVVIFRVVGNQRMGAVFNIKTISRGEAVDPIIEPNDTVVIGYSSVKAAWRDFLLAAPLIGVFTRF
jgi:polysaccharide export outer membrane protein